MFSDYSVLIIEDDFKVAAINQQFVEQINGFSVIGIAKTGAEALQLIEQQVPDLILLDVYIPDVTGLDLLWKIREMERNVDVIMITAAKEVATIEESLRGGVFDYIIKPIEFTRFEQTLQRYAHKRKLLVNKHEMGQGEIDRLWRIQENPMNLESETELPVPKGIDPLTLNKVQAVLEKEMEKGLTAVQLGIEIGSSRTTARRYLEYLVSLGNIKAELKYGEVGRPERRYFPL